MPYSEKGQFCTMKIVIVTTQVGRDKGWALWWPSKDTIGQNPYLNLSKRLIKVKHTWNLKQSTDKEPHKCSSHFGSHLGYRLSDKIHIQTWARV